MKITKSKAFLLGLVAILIVDIGAVLQKIDASTASLTAIVSLCGLFMSANVADNGVKGKFYQEGLNKG